MKMESIVQGIRDCDLPDGEYEIFIKDQIYTIELINYYDDVRYSLKSGETSKTISLGDSSTDYKMVVVKYHKSLRIDKGVTLTATNVNGLTYKKGMYICVLGDIRNDGEISMTARGTYNAEGENVYLWKNIDETYEYVPAEGAEGAHGETVTSIRSRTVVAEGKQGETGKNRALGGGGAGAVSAWRNVGGVKTTQGSGAKATSYSGGSGSGSVVFGLNNTKEDNGYSAEPNGGAGRKRNRRTRKYQS